MLQCGAALLLAKYPGLRCLMSDPTIRLPFSSLHGGDMADEWTPENPPDRAAARQVAVVVVHGVGETTPGYAVNELVDTIERQFPDEFRAQRHCEVHPMAGEPLYGLGDGPDSFPATVRGAHLPGTGESVRFYELYWADRTRTLPGRLNAFLAPFASSSSCISSSTRCCLRTEDR